MFDTGRRLDALEQDLEGLSNAVAALRLEVDATDADAILLARQGRGNAVRDATEAHGRQLEAHRDKCLGVLSDEGARLVAEAKAASHSALTEVRTLGRRMGIDTRP
jgi:hypothetical protein